MTAYATSVVDPFAAKIAAAEAAKAEREAARLAAIEVARAEREAAEARAAAMAPIENAREFGHRFTTAVADKIVTATMSPELMRQVQAYTVGLLSKVDSNLPSIGEKLAQKILDKFEYGLMLAEQHSQPVPSDLFYGQRLLAERATAKETEARTKEEAKQAVLHIVKAPRPRAPREEAARATAAVELKPAITRKGGGKAKRA